MVEPEVVATGYTVSCLPKDHREYRNFSIAVTLRNRAEGLWALERWGEVWSKSRKEWIYEQIPSERTKEFLEDTRFSLEEALELAKELAPDLTTMGWDVQKALKERDK